MPNDQGDDSRSKRVVLSGASGLVGTALAELLRQRGYGVVRLVRNAPEGADEARWDPEGGTIDRSAIAGATAFIHLSGENVSGGRWSEERKRRIVDSRMKSTDLLARTVAALRDKPRVFVCASAIGYYGSRGDEELDEQSSPGTDFLAETCRDWERATRPASDAGIRTVSLRFGVVLSPKGGALAKLLPIFKMGVGGPIGDGKQYFSWIGITDTIGAAAFALTEESLRGPVNVVSPTPVRNRDFAKALGGVLGRPSFFPVPKAAIELAFGEMGRETILASQRVLPTKLAKAGYLFQHPDLEGALRHELGKD